MKLPWRTYDVQFKCPLCKREAWDYPTSKSGIRKYCVCGNYMDEVKK